MISYIWRGAWVVASVFGMGGVAWKGSDQRCIWRFVGSLQVKIFAQ